MNKWKPSKRSCTHQTYRTSDGLVVPGVTSITGLLGFATEKLIYWGWNLGSQNLDYKVVRTELAAVGTLAHSMITNHLLNTSLCDPIINTEEYAQNIISAAENSLIKFYEWETHHELKPIFLEKPLVSEKYKFGGKPDFYGELDQQLSLVDFKTGAGIYEDNFIQLAGYELLLNESGYEVEQRLILHLSRDEREGYKEYTRPDLTAETIIFLAAKRIYETKKILDIRRK